MERGGRGAAGAAGDEPVPGDGTANARVAVGPEGVGPESGGSAGDDI